MSSYKKVVLQEHHGHTYVDVHSEEHNLDFRFYSKTNSSYIEPGRTVRICQSSYWGCLYVRPIKTPGKLEELPYDNINSPFGGIHKTPSTSIREVWTGPTPLKLIEVLDIALSAIGSEGLSRAVVEEFANPLSGLSSSYPDVISKVYAKMLISGAIKGIAPALQSEHQFNLSTYGSLVTEKLGICPVCGKAYFYTVDRVSPALGGESKTKSMFCHPEMVYCTQVKVMKPVVIEEYAEVPVYDSPVTSVGIHYVSEDTAGGLKKLLSIESVEW